MQSTPLGKWIGKSHQHWVDSINVRTGELYKNEYMNEDVVPVDLNVDESMRVLGYQNNVLPAVEKINPENPMEAIQIAPKWMHNLWN